MNSADIAAARGAARMDRHDPGWARRIDRSRLTIVNTDDCVVGQYFRDFRIGVDRLGLREEEIFTHGFDAADGDYDSLDRAWDRQVRHRLVRVAA